MDTLAGTPDLAQRYGRHRPVRRVVLVVAVVLLAGAFLGWLAWAAWIHANPAVDAQVTSFDVKGAHQVRATVRLQVRDRSVDGSCLLRASADDHAIVGELTVPVRDASGRLVRRYDVRTEREATTVEVVSCTGSG